VQNQDSIISTNPLLKPSENTSVIILGIFSTLLIVLFTMVYSSLFGLDAYIGWVAFIWMTAVPAQIILGLHLQFNAPKSLATLPQPQKGLAYLLLTLIMMFVGGIYLYLFPGGMSPPGPFLIMATITTISSTFWLVGAWQCWPFSLMTKDPFKQGLLTLLASYGVGAVFFQWGFNFTAMAQAPVYIDALDPKGPVDAWIALSFSVTTVAVLMVLSLFEYRPCTLFATTQPGLGISITLVTLAISSALYFPAVVYAHIDPVEFMVRVPVSIIFGVFLVTNMMQFQLFKNYSQPIRGILLLLLTILLACVMYALYRAAIPYIIGDLQQGAPTYEVELWVATALLSITFPMINLVSGYFEFWPLMRKKP